LATNAFVGVDKKVLIFIVDESSGKIRAVRTSDLGGGGGVASEVKIKGDLDIVAKQRDTGELVFFTKTSSSGDYDRVSVGATPTVVVPANEDRVWILLRNEGPETVYIGFDDSVDPTNGMPLEPGESVPLPHSGSIYAVSSGAGSTIKYMEGTA